MFTVSAHRQNSGIGIAFLGMSVAAMICAFAFLLLPTFFPARREAVPPITIDLFLGPDHKVAAIQGAAITRQLSATAKRHGLTALDSTNHPKLGVDGDGARPSTADGRT